MRPMTETRKRRLSDPQVLANKRLTNGFSKVDHVTTRSQAKNDPTSRVSPTRMAKQKCLSTEERRLTISMRLRHEERHTTQASLNASQAQEESKRKFSRSRSHLTTNGRTNGMSSPIKTSVRSTLRTRINGYVNDQQNEITDRSMQETLKRATEVKNREIRAKKRRSALWVLNCEAEEFLFGETAAEDHEVELPPISSPPKKRRRMRTTELGELLKETPLLESKLRNSTAGCSESEVSSETSEVGPRSKQKRNDNKRRYNRTKNSSRVQKLELESSNISEVDVEDEEDDCGSDLEFSSLSYTLMLEAAAAASSSSSASQNDSSPSEQSVRIKRILNSIEYSFSFENVPSSEVWYRTFSHQNRPRHTFHSPTENLVILPYQVKGINRDLAKRLRRPPRKSPRCHASTQAILSALKPTRRGGGGSRPPSPSSAPLPSTSSSKSKPINIASHIQETHVSSTSLRSIPTMGSQSLFSSSTPLPQQPPSLIAPNAIQNGIKVCEMTATQYLWDSIQFLSDPYVIHVLSQSDPRYSPRGRNHLNKIESSSGEVSPDKSSGRRLSSIYVNHNNNIKAPLKLVIPSPKTSPGPRFCFTAGTVSASPSPTLSSPSQNGNCSKLDFRRLLRSPTASTTSSDPSSPGSSPPPPPSPLHSPTGSGIVRKSPRKGSTSGLIISAESHTFHVKNNSYTNFASKFKSVSPKFSSFPIFPLPSPSVEVLFSPQNSLPDFPWDSFI